jgi:hypothetical protein
LSCPACFGDAAAVAACELLVPDGLRDRVTVVDCEAAARMDGFGVASGVLLRPPVPPDFGECLSLVEAERSRLDSFVATCPSCVLPHDLRYRVTVVDCMNGVSG